MTAGDEEAAAPRLTQNGQGLTSSCPDGHGLMTYHPDDGTPGGEWWECPVCKLQCMWPDPAARAPRLEPLDVLALASRLESTFDPGGNLPDVRAALPRVPEPDLEPLIAKWLEHADSIACALKGGQARRVELEFKGIERTYRECASQLRAARAWAEAPPEPS